MVNFLTRFSSPERTRYIRQEPLTWARQAAPGVRCGVARLKDHLPLGAPVEGDPTVPPATSAQGHLCPRPRGAVASSGWAPGLGLPESSPPRCAHPRTSSLSEVMAHVPQQSGEPRRSLPGKLPGPVCKPGSGGEARPSGVLPRGGKIRALSFFISCSEVTGRCV